MNRIVAATFGAAVIASSLAGAANADTRHIRRHPSPPAMSTDTRDAYDYYPGWGRDKVTVRGVYPGLIYGGATSPPAGR
jgi:hypothetical protein